MLPRLSQVVPEWHEKRLNDLVAVRINSRLAVLAVEENIPEVPINFATLSAGNAANWDI